MRLISMATCDELVAAVAGRYALGNRAERSRILDEFVAVTDHHRKHAMRLLRVGLSSGSSGPRPDPRLPPQAAPPRPHPVLTLSRGSSQAVVPPLP